MAYTIQRPLAEFREILATYKQGSPRTRNGYKSVIKVIIKDLFFLKVFFNSFHEVSLDQINSLINHWKKRKLLNVTIGSRLSILRKYLGLLNHSVPFPSNLELGLTRKKSKLTVALIAAPLQILDQVEHRLTKYILKLQIYFGLTKQEAIKFRIQPYQAVKNALYISKSVSHNNKDRLISLHFPEQEQLLSQLAIELGLKLSLSEKYDKVTLVNLYNTELVLANHSSKTSFRALYARNLFDYLVNQQQLTKKEALVEIAGEMGISDLKLIRDWISDE